MGRMAVLNGDAIRVKIEMIPVGQIKCRVVPVPKHLEAALSKAANQPLVIVRLGEQRYELEGRNALRFNYLKRTRTVVPCIVMDNTKEVTNVRQTIT